MDTCSDVMTILKLKILRLSLKNFYRVFYHACIEFEGSFSMGCYRVIPRVITPIIVCVKSRIVYITLRNGNSTVIN